MKTKCRCYLNWCFVAFFAAITGAAHDTINLGQGLTLNQTIVSKNGTFELGFFSPSGADKWYIGIWYAGIPRRTYVWVANRETPVGSSAALQFTDNGQLAVVDAHNISVWETGNRQRASRAVILDSGNLVLMESSDDGVVWESFENPTETWLPGMKIRYGQSLTSWKTATDPAPGDFSLQLRLHSGTAKFSEFVLVWRNSVPYWSSGKWDGYSFPYVPEMTIKYIYNFTFVNPNSFDGYFTYTELPQFSVMSRFAIDVFGEIKQYAWTYQADNWNMFWMRPVDICTVYGLCGPNGVCSDGGNDLQYCRCLEGFEPRTPQAWNSRDWSGGCIRSSSFQCKTDKFYELGSVDLNSSSSVLIPEVLIESCEKFCVNNISCIGYAYKRVSKDCRLVWGDLWNLRNYSSDDEDDSAGYSPSGSNNSMLLYFRVASCRSSSRRKGNPGVLIGAFSGVWVFALVTALSLFCWKQRNPEKHSTSEEGFSGMMLSMFAYKDLHIATRNFSEKLGSGGFGSVYKGTLAGSIPIAVKKLERPEGGEKQFRMEVSTIGMIQHVNLVRLRGFCSEGDRRLLVYDYMPNGSLNTFLFREHKKFLDWKTRFQIALGAARAIAYLHEGCRDCIVHCDIKPENILLDEDFNAKVSDFGMAKLIGRDFSCVLTTMRGTRGYLAPEWISGLPITAKADVYSFGMTLLEIMGGRRNIESGNVESEKWFFPTWAAKQVRLGNILELVDDRLGKDIDVEEVRRTAMVAIWCIQDGEGSRPRMGTIVKMLEGVVDVLTPPIPRTLQSLMDENSETQVMTMDSDSSSLVSSPSITVKF